MWRRAELLSARRFLTNESTTVGSFPIVPVPNADGTTEHKRYIEGIAKRDRHLSRSGCPICSACCSARRPALNTKLTKRTRRVWVAPRPAKPCGFTVDPRWRRNRCGTPPGIYESRTTSRLI